MTVLAEVLLDADRRPAVVTALTEVVEAEVKEKKGLSGTAVKASYATARKASPTIVPRVIDKLLPDYAAALEPYWAEFSTSGTTDFGAFLAARSDQVATALLAVTDKRVEGSSREMLKKAYRGIRGKAEGNVVTALPRLGATIAGFLA